MNFDHVGPIGGGMTALVNPGLPVTVSIVPAGPLTAVDTVGLDCQRPWIRWAKGDLNPHVPKDTGT
jgi:hypothetical protein